MDRFDAAKAVRDLIEYFGHEFNEVSSIRFGPTEAAVDVFDFNPPKRPGQALDVSRLTTVTTHTYRFNPGARQDDEVPG